MREGHVKEEVLDYELVKDFITAAHGNFEKVKEMLEAEPRLLHATINWGGSDWESALGAAAHLGKRDIAEWLLQKGARMDIFTAAMLGDLPIVIEMIRRQPEAIYAPGPHGIPLLHHARMGGEEAKATFEYIAKLTQEVPVV